MSGTSFPHRGTPILPARTATPGSNTGDGESDHNIFRMSDAGIDSATESSARDITRGSRGHDTGMPTHESRPGGRPKRTLIESACAACRRRKSRCDGIRPACSRCQTLRTECAYEAEEGESRWSALRRRNQMLENERSELRELLSYIQTRPEQEAQEIFNRIRSGGYDDVFNILRQIREHDTPANASRSSTPTRNIMPMPLHPEQPRLPSIRSMFDVSAPLPITPGMMPHPPPPLLTPEHSRGSTSSGGSMDYSKTYPTM